MLLLAAEAAAAPPTPPSEPHPWYVEAIFDFGGWFVMALAVLAFIKYGWPPLLKMVKAFFNRMEQHIIDQRTAFTMAEKQSRDDYREERVLDREAQKEATMASASVAASQAKLADSMDRFAGRVEGFSNDLNDLPERIRRATSQQLAPTAAEVAEARKLKLAEEGRA